MSRIAAGETYKEIALDIGRSVETVRFAKLGLVGRGASTAVVVMKDSGWLGAPPRGPHVRDDSRDVTPTQRAYNEWFVRLCKERSELGEAATTAAAKLVSVDAAEPFARRDARAPYRPDIETLLLRMALALTAGRAPDSGVEN